MQDDTRMRQGDDFDLLRKNYPVRREFSSLTLQGITHAKSEDMMHGLGFSIEQERH
jgi:erythronate-4-phosphate dehydrogenase